MGCAVEEYAAAGQGECKDMGEDRPLGGMEFPYNAGSTFPYRNPEE